MRQAIALCDLGTAIWNKSPDESLVAGLWAGIGTAYARPFTQNDGISSLESKFAHFHSTQLKARHDWLMNLRHNQLAHKNRLWEQTTAEQIGAKDEISRIILTVFPDGNTEWQVTGITYPNVYFSGIKELCKFQQHRLAEASNKMLLHHLKSHDIGPRTYDLGRDFTTTEAETQGAL